MEKSELKIYLSISIIIRIIFHKIMILHKVYLWVEKKQLFFKIFNYVLINAISRQFKLNYCIKKEIQKFDIR